MIEKSKMVDFLRNKCNIDKNIEQYKKLNTEFGFERFEFFIIHNKKKYKIKILQSTKLVEKPINIIIPKEILKQLSEEIYNI